MSNLWNGWALIQEYLCDLEVNTQDDLKFIELSPGEGESEIAPCLKLLTMGDKISYALCITEFFGTTSPAFLLCEGLLDRDGDFGEVEIKNPRDVLEIPKDQIPEVITTFLESAFAHGEKGAEMCPMCNGKKRVPVSSINSGKSLMNCPECDGVGKMGVK